MEFVLQLQADALQAALLVTTLKIQLLVQNALMALD